MAASMPSVLGRRTDRLFYGGMFIVIAAIVFVGFSRTFYLSPWFHGPALTPLRVVHGTLFSAWILLLITQTSLITAGRTDIHRRVGVGGAVLAAVMVVVGTVLAISNAREGRAPPGIGPLQFLAIPLFDMVVFSVLVTLGISFRRQSETHKRLMLLATLTLLAAAVARLPTSLAAAGPPFYFGVVDGLVLVGVVYDLITRRKVHPVYLWGGLFMVGSQVLRLAVSGTPGWLAFATMLVGR